MLTAQQNNTSNGAAFDGNIVVFENRPFCARPGHGGRAAVYQAAGETVVEAVFGAGSNVGTTRAGRATAPAPTGPCCCAGTPAQPDPVVKVGDWIADVTYERNQNLVILPVLLQYNAPDRRAEPAEQRRMGQPAGAALLLVPGAEGDPGPARPGARGQHYRSMTVYVNRPLDAKTLLDGNGNPGS